MKKEDYDTMLANASEGTKRLNQVVATRLPTAKPKPCTVSPLASGEADEGRGTRCRHIRITARRVRLQDPDNGIHKFIIDALRYNGIIKDDTTKDITLEVRQEKVSQKIKQGTLIEII